MRRSSTASVLQALFAPLHAAALCIQLADSHSTTAAMPVACATEYEGRPGRPMRLPPGPGLHWRGAETCAGEHDVPAVGVTAQHGLNSLHDAVGGPRPQHLYAAAPPAGRLAPRGEGRKWLQRASSAAARLLDHGEQHAKSLHAITTNRNFFKAGGAVPSGPIFHSP